MKRLHVHVAVSDLEASIRFYSALFAAQPSVIKSDYAKWMLDDPRVNFAISRRGATPGLNHLGVQAENAAELDELHQRLQALAAPVVDEPGAACCYARSDKHWVNDPEGIPWEAFHTLDSIPVFGDSKGAAGETACCAPPLTPAQTSGCCTPGPAAGAGASGAATCC